MKLPVFSKVFLVFSLFAFGLFGILFLVFNNFYYLNSKNEDKKKSEYILNEQEIIFKDFIKRYDEKIVLIESIVSKLNDEKQIIDFIENIIFKDKTILSFKIVSLNAKETLKLNNNFGESIKVVEYNNLRNLFATNYFKHMRVLDYQEIYHYSLNDSKNTINFIIRSKDNFYSIEINLKNILETIINKYPKKIFIANTHNDYINSNFPINLNSDNYIIKKIQIEEDSNFTFLIELNKEFI